jgi:RNA polymerase sigma factor (sigma-70 family)
MQLPEARGARRILGNQPIRSPNPEPCGSCDSPIAPRRFRTTVSCQPGFAGPRAFGSIHVLRIAAVSKGILERVAAGEAAAVEQCLATYRGLVWALARRSIANLTDAEDAVQEIFIELWRTAGRFDPALSSEPTYITMVAKRRLIDRFRRARRTPETSSLSNETGLEAVATPQADRVGQDEEAAQIRRQMQRLRREERLVLELSIEQGMSQSEIAVATKLPLGTVKTHARRGMMRLRELLGQNSVDTSPGGPE